MTIFAKLKERLSFLLGKSKIVENIQLKVSDKVPVVSSFIADSQKQSLDTTNNKDIRRKQYNFLLLLLGGSIITVLVLINIMQGKIKHKAIINDNTKPKLEVASEALDPEKMWHNHFEDLLNDNRRKFDERLQLAETSFREKEQKLQEEIKLELTKMQIQLNFAKNELISSTEELKRMRQIHQEAEQNTKGKDFGSDVNIGVIDLNGEIEFDKPKDTKIYIPETSYVSGYLLGGLAVSTALNTPDEHATPIVIRLTERGNLPKNFNLDITTCRILGSSYGDLSSERVIIRLEKMVCIDPITELVTASNIAGIVHGPDGMNGIKGKVVATSSKHIKNALIGGVISGLSQSSKGLDSMTITGLGAIASPKKGFKDMVTDGILSGTSNAAEKIADYYLRMAENMSPVLTIPSGVKVDVVFMKGFFVGELTTHKKIAKERTKKPTNKQYGEQ